jgi:hypothetical protein
MGAIADSPKRVDYPLNRKNFARNVLIRGGSTMKSINIHEFKNNPSEALRMARQDILIIMNQNKPEALLLHLDEDKMTPHDAKVAFATALFRDGSLPVGRAARVADMAHIDFIAHLSRLGLSVFTGSETEQRAQLQTDIAALDQWLDK